MAALGARADRTVAVLGPAVCPDCYAVPAERVDEVEQVAPGVAARTPAGEPSLDLRSGLATRLANRGVAVSEVGRLHRGVRRAVQLPQGGP